MLGATRFTGALLEAIEDPVLRDLPPVGAVDQFVDSTDVLSRPALARASVAGVASPGPGS